MAMTYKAQGDSWEEIIKKLGADKAARSAHALF